MTLQELIAALTGGERHSAAPYIRERDTRPFPQAPARYPGQPGALRRDPISQWVDGVQGPAQERMSVLRTQEGGFRRPVGPGGVTGDEPPLRVPFAALNGPRPSMGTAADWIQGPPRGVSPAPYISDGPRDMEPWRSPIDTERMAAGDPAPQRGMEPPSLSAMPPPTGQPAPDDLEAQIAMARQRAQGALSRQSDPTGMRAAARRELLEQQARELERERRYYTPLRR